MREEGIMERTNEMQIEFDARSCNEGFVRVSVAAFLYAVKPHVRRSSRHQDRSVGGDHKRDDSRIRG